MENRETPDILISDESTLTDRYQTTVPDVVRKTLGLGKRDKIRYDIGGDGSVTLSKSGGEEDDPVLDRFLEFLAHDIQDHPDGLRALDGALLDRIKPLIDGVEIDLETPLLPEDD